MRLLTVKIDLDSIADVAKYRALGESVNNFTGFMVTEIMTEVSKEGGSQKDHISNNALRRTAMLYEVTNEAEKLQPNNEYSYDVIV